MNHLVISFVAIITKQTIITYNFLRDIFEFCVTCFANHDTFNCMLSALKVEVMVSETCWAVCKNSLQETLSKDNFYMYVHIHSYTKLLDFAMSTVIYVNPDAGHM